jgi:hypothetical protein
MRATTGGNNCQTQRGVYTVFEPCLQKHITVSLKKYDTSTRRCEAEKIHGKKINGRVLVR